MCKRPCSRPLSKWRDRLDAIPPTLTPLCHICSIYIFSLSIPKEVNILSWKKVWGRYKKQRKLINGEKGEKQVQRECLGKWRFWKPGSSMTSALFMASSSPFFMCISLQPINTLPLYPDNKLIIFILNNTKREMTTASYFLHCLFPIQYHIATWIICLKCKFHHITPPLQNGFSPTVSQPYIGF